MEKVCINLKQKIVNNDVINIDYYKIDINDIVNNYLNYVLTFKSLDTYNCYSGHLLIIINYLKNKYKVNYDLDINIDMLFDFIKFQRKNNLSEATINKRINVFKRAFKYSASKLDLSKLSTMKEKYVTYDFLRDEEIDKLINYVEKSNMSIRNKLIVFLLLESGIRRKEIFKIKIRNIDFDNRIILLDYTKNNEPRFIMFDDYTDKYLNLYLQIHDVNNKYLFDISRVAFDNIFKRIKKQLNLQKFSSYVLRHTYATIIVNNDGNIEMLKTTMGHMKLSTTQRYIHYNKNLLRQSYDKAFSIKGIYTCLKD